MDTTEMLNKMCHLELTVVDIKALCKSRGFTSREANSRNLLEGFFLSETGVANALGSLTRDEVILFHLMKLIPVTVDAAFFDRIYGTENSRKWRFGTFNQKYKDIFKQVKTSLIRRGVILFAEEHETWEKNTKLERLRFRFPEEFHPFLPLPFGPVRSIPGPGNFNQTVIKDKLMEILNCQTSVSEANGAKHSLSIKDGELRMGGKEFRAEYLVEWQRDIWDLALKEESYKKAGQGSVSPTKAAAYAFSLLMPGEWILPDELSSLFKIFCYDMDQPDPEKVCHAGWKQGCLARQTIAEKTYYALPEDHTDAGVQMDPGRFLKKTSDGAVIVDISTIPYASLEFLAWISNFRVAGSQLTAFPNSVKLGRIVMDIDLVPLTSWLRKNASAFAGAISMIEQRWGKLVVHQNLLVARIRDLSLKVAIQKAFADSGKVVFLPDNFIAFPNDLTKKMEALVNKSGYVVKAIEVSDSEKINYPI